MDLSVIIVSYNVKHFLEQCLLSVFNALDGIEAEVIVVDNASGDGSCEMVRERFKPVKLIENTTNVGFSRANNQAIAIAKGEFILLLNPDTVLQEDTLVRCLSFMRNHPDAGGLTVKMIDGKGKFLPESKRGFPSPVTAFFKIFGFASLFPRSKTFARYYLGHLDKNSTHEIEVLPGAFMFLRAKTLREVGLLDEQFFMYGEDIDLSYRILKGGYKNYYYPECQIIHYKGESTRKGSLNYVLVFYRAMILFTKKHVNSRGAGLLVGIINLAIYFRAFLSLLHRLAKRLWLPLLDLALIIAGVALIVPWWEQQRFQMQHVYPREYAGFLLSLYVAVWMLSLWLGGAYDKPRKVHAPSRSIAVGTVAILVIYSVLPAGMRFSRAIIIITGAWSLATTQLVRYLMVWISPSSFATSLAAKRIAVLGNSNEVERVSKILNLTGISYKLVVSLTPDKLTGDNGYLNHERLAELVRVNGVNEIIFCTQGISMGAIVDAMLYLSPQGVSYKIATREGSSIIGSNSIEAQGELYTLDFKALGSPSVKRAKRLFDLFSAAAVIITWPVNAFFIRKPFRVMVEALSVLVGLKTWVGYGAASPEALSALPKIKPSVFPYIPVKYPEKNSTRELYLYYARNYSVSLDLQILIRNLYRGING